MSHLTAEQMELLRASAKDETALARLLELFRQQNGEHEHDVDELCALFTHNFDAVAIVGLDRRVRSVNDRAVEMFGLPREELVGRLARIDGTEQQTAAADERWQRLLAGENLPLIERHLPRADGSSFPVEISMVLVRDAAGRPLHVQCILRDISARKTAEDELRASEEHFRLLAENAHDLIILHTPNGSALYISPSCEALLGYKPEELARLDPYDLFHPQDRERIRDESHYPMMRGEVDGAEIIYRIQHRNGHYLWMETRSRVVRDGQGKVQRLVTISRDVTDQQHTHTALHKRDAIMNAVNYAAVQFLQSTGWKQRADRVLEQVGMAAGVSRAYLFELHEGPHGQLLASERYRWAAPDSPPVPEAYAYNLPVTESEFWPRLEKGQPVYMHADELSGRERDFLQAQGVHSMALMPISVYGQFWGGIGFDVCGRRRDWTVAELDALQTSASIFGAAVEREIAEDNYRDLLKERERVKILSRFITDASHEFNTPLSVINTNVYLLRRILSDARALRYIEMIQAQSDGLRTLVADLVTMARLDIAAENELEPPEPQHLRQVVESLMARLGPAALEKGLLLSTELRPGLPPVAMAAADLMTALSKLVENAIRYTPEGGRVVLRAEQKGRHVAISVEDTGVGISTEDLPRIFERFARGDQAHTTRGFGLGLAITRRVAENSGGRIEVESTPGQGSIFRLLLPAAAAG